MLARRGIAKKASEIVKPWQNNLMIDKAFLIVTTRCNLACDFCYYKTGILPNVEDPLATGDFVTVLDELAEIGAKAVSFTGGEPLLRADIVHLVRHATKLGLRTIIVSNGRLSTPDLLRELRAAGLEMFALSIHTGEANELEELSRILEMLRTIGLRVRCNFVLSIQNSARAPQILYLLKQYEVEDAFFQPLSLPRWDSRRKTLCLESASIFEIRAVLDTMKDWCDQYKLHDYRKYLMDYYSSVDLAASCRIALRRLIVNADGQVPLCFYFRETVMGNVTRTPLRMIVRKMHKDQYVIDARRCRGEHCLAMFYFTNILPFANPPPPNKSRMIIHSEVSDEER